MVNGFLRRIIEDGKCTLSYFKDNELQGNHIHIKDDGNIWQTYTGFHKYSEITDIVDISGSLETSGKKDISKINIFLENINKVKNEN